MQAKWGIAWLLTAFWLVAATCVPALASGDYAFRSLPILPIEAQSSLETQMLGETPQVPAVPKTSQAFRLLRLFSSSKMVTPPLICLATWNSISPSGIIENRLRWKLAAA